MPLNLTVFNQFYAINKICGQEKQRHYLESLGFVPGARISILKKKFLRFSITEAKKSSTPGFRFCRSFTVIISSW